MQFQILSPRPIDSEGSATAPRLSDYAQERGLIFAAPECRRVDSLMAQIDIAPTLLGLQKRVLNQNYDAARDCYLDKAAVNPELNELAIPYYQTAYELFRAHKFDLPSP